jgi:hypothetical protein
MKPSSQTRYEIGEKAATQIGLHNNYCKSWCLQTETNLVDKHSNHGA